MVYLGDLSGREARNGTRGAAAGECPAVRARGNPAARLLAPCSLACSICLCSTGRVPSDPPWAPAIVRLNDAAVAHLLAWELMELDGSCWAWVSWIQQNGGRPLHKIVNVRAAVLQPLDDPASYEKVPRRVRGRDGMIRAWSGEIS
jgi:hypothetical protein